MTYLRTIPFSGDVLEEVSQERGRQDAKWGEQNHPNGTGDQVALLHGWTLPKQLGLVPVTMGAFAYTARSVTDAAAEAGTVTFADILLEEVAEAFAEEDPAKLREELIQVAAVAVAWIETIDRKATS